ncbi:MAG: hypothetical protein V1702_00045 [Candidatus Woesearchaeota archaeon]
METLSKLEVDDLVKRLEEQFASNPEDMRTAIEKGNDEIHSSRGVSAKRSYDNISMHLGALLKTQKAIDYATKAGSSPVFKSLEAIKAKFSRASGSNYAPETLDQLTEKQFDIIGSLKGSIKDARRDAESALSSLVHYKDNVVFKNFADALETKRCSEKDLDYLTKLHHDAAHVLGNIKKSDPSYVTIAKRQRGVRRSIQSRLTEIAKANQQIVFGDSALKSLEECEDVENMFVLLLDQVEQYASSSLEYAKNKKKLHDFSTGGEEIIRASQMICGSLSRTLSMQSSQLDTSMQRIKAIASKAQYKMLLPDSMMAEKGGYASDILDVTKGINLQLENKARAVMESYGQPST